MCIENADETHIIVQRLVGKIGELPDICHIHPKVAGRLGKSGNMASSFGRRGATAEATKYNEQWKSGID